MGLACASGTGRTKKVCDNNDQGSIVRAATRSIEGEAFGNKQRPQRARML